MNETTERNTAQDALRLRQLSMERGETLAGEIALYWLEKAEQLGQEVHGLRGELHGVRLKLDVEQARSRALADALRELLDITRNYSNLVFIPKHLPLLNRAAKVLAELDYARE